METSDSVWERLPLSGFGTIHPPLTAGILKAEWVAPLLDFDKIE
jgi:hypothetical protein